MAEQAELTFSANTSLTEKIQRVFNGMMFFIVGANLLNLILPVGALFSTLSSIGFAAIGGAYLLQIPTVVAIMALAPKIILVIAIIQVIRKVLAVVINFFVYPAMSKHPDKTVIDHKRWETFETLTNEKFECRRVALNKSGINYDAFVYEHEETKGNGQWVIVAGGNMEVAEYTSDMAARRFKELGFNVLYVNGPAVGRSSGFPTSYSIGAGQEAGLQFLENRVGAKKILLYGLSLGGGAQSEAIVNHEFKTETVDYIVWTDRSFVKLSDIASTLVTTLVKPIFFLLGIELDGIAAARKLVQLGITHIVTQNSQIIDSHGILPLDIDFIDEGTDQVIPNRVSLYEGLRQAGIQDSELLKCYGGPHVNHDGSLPQVIQELVRNDIEAFLAKLD